MEKLTSVCMTTYNGERYIEAQLRSILQSCQISEVLVSDDGSSDRTIEIVQSIADSRVRVLRGPGKGLIRNFESVLQASRGEYIFLADQDDIWLPNKVSTTLEALRTFDLIVSDCIVVSEELLTIQPSFFEMRRSGPGLIKNLMRNSYLGCCMAFRRSVLGFALPFPRDLPMHDWWLGLITERFGSVRFLQTPLLQYRRHAHNASTTGAQSPTGWRTQLAWRTSITASLIRREFVSRIGLGS